MRHEYVILRGLGTDQECVAAGDAELPVEDWPSALKVLSATRHPDWPIVPGDIVLFGRYAFVREDDGWRTVKGWRDVDRRRMQAE